eukprot:2547877-Rhodomonas_salina.1
MVPGPASARLLYSHPITDYHSIERLAFGFGDNMPAADKCHLAEYSRVVCQKLQVDPGTLS